MEDWRLLQEYLDRGSEAAFTALMGRHMNLVYSAALRRLGDPEAARDVTQSVFCLLAPAAGRAVNEFSKYLRHHPDDYPTQMHLANLLALQKKYDDAYRLYQELAKRTAGDPTLWFNFALVSKEKNDLEGALAAFRKLHQLVKELPEGGLYQEGEVWRLKGSDDKAMALYQQEISLHPSFMYAYISLEAAQRRRGLTKEARETRKTITALKAK